MRFIYSFRLNYSFVATGNLRGIILKFRRITFTQRGSAKGRRIFAFGTENITNACLFVEINISLGYLRGTLRIGVESPQCLSSLIWVLVLSTKTKEIGNQQKCFYVSIEKFFEAFSRGQIETAPKYWNPKKFGYRIF